MSQTPPILNKDAPIIFMQGEETAGVVGNLLRREILTPLGIGYETRDISVAERVLSRGKIVQRVSEEIAHASKATLVKEPGVTPSPTQLLHAASQLERDGRLHFDDEALNKAIEDLRQKHQPLASDEGMASFAYAIVGAKKPVGYMGSAFDNGDGLMDASGSPNAVWRKLLQATLLRSVSAKLEENSTAQMPAWSKDTPLHVLAWQQSAENSQFARVTAGDYTVRFTADKSGEVKTIGQMQIEGDQTPIRLYSGSKAAFMNWMKAQLDIIGDGQIVHALKQTVITTDYAYIEWMDEALAAAGKSSQIHPIAQDASDASTLSTKFLADNAIGALASNPPISATYMLSPNASYASFVEIMQGIREAGGFVLPSNSEIVRGSATKDHYARLEYRAEVAGTLEVLDAENTPLLSKTMAEDDIAMVTNLDRARVKTLVRQSLDHAAASGKTSVLFGFDPNDIYYGIVHEELAAIRTDTAYAGLDINEGDASAMTINYFTSGAKNTLLVLGNIQGDFATDVELMGKGTSYSKALLSDGRMAIETGSLGTAPDILHDPEKPFGWKRDGVLVYNPMAFVEAYAYALEGVARNMGNDALMKRTADALEAAIYRTTRKGYMLPISRGTLKLNDNTSETFVGTHGFVLHILLETLDALRGDHPAATPENISAVEQAFHMQKAIDIAAFEILAAKDARSGAWKALNWQINEAKAAAGEIDMAAPDYSITLPAGTDPSSINADTLFALRSQEAERLGLKAA